jgi:hypothetical protein
MKNYTSKNNAVLKLTFCFALNVMACPHLKASNCNVVYRIPFAHLLIL